MPPETPDVYRAPMGTHDLLPPETDRWIEVVSVFARRAARYGYGLVVTPVFEHREVFQRVGESTDVVRKEMYEFVDKGDREMALRPEGTAPVVRAYVQHRPTPPWKVWYLAPLFRYERPQKGRYRQHWQLGAEVVGADDPDVDVEVISFVAGFLGELGLRRWRLLLNSMGDPESRREYVSVLRDYLLGHAGNLGPDFTERVRENPLRILDSKRDDWADVIERGPQLTEHLGDESRRHFEAVQRGLDDLGIDYELAPRLVRGFDYYTSTTFEFVSDALDAAQNAVAGGGRYDQLAEAMGGPATPGIGFGLGMERLLVVADAEGAVPAGRARLDVFVVDGLGGGREAMALTHDLRQAGLRTDRSYGGRSMKAQFKVADRSGAAFAAVLGQAELERGEVRVKEMESGEEVDVPRDQLVAWLRAKREFDR
ncbi:MAG: histidine--tRNA ligase [Acidimicrobiales bacterium]